MTLNLETMTDLEFWPWGLYVISLLSIAIGWFACEIWNRRRLAAIKEVVQSQEREYVKLAQKHVESRQEDKKRIQDLESRASNQDEHPVQSLLSELRVESSPDDIELVTRLYREIEQLKMDKATLKDQLAVKGVSDSEGGRDMNVTAEKMEEARQKDHELIRDMRDELNRLRIKNGELQNLLSAKEEAEANDLQGHSSDFDRDADHRLIQSLEEDLAGLRMEYDSIKRQFELQSELIARDKTDHHTELHHPDDHELIRLLKEENESLRLEKAELTNWVEAHSARADSENNQGINPEELENNRQLIQSLQDEVDQLRIRNQKLSSVPSALFIEKNKSLKEELKRIRKKMEKKARKRAEREEDLKDKIRRLKRKFKKSRRRTEKEVRVVERIDFKKLKKILNDLPVKKSIITIYPCKKDRSTKDNQDKSS